MSGTAFRALRSVSAAVGKPALPFEYLRQGDIGLVAFRIRSQKPLEKRGDVRIPAGAFQSRHFDQHLIPREGRLICRGCRRATLERLSCARHRGARQHDDHAHECRACNHPHRISPLLFAKTPKTGASSDWDSGGWG